MGRASGARERGGNLDVISLHQAGFTNAVAGLGTALTEEQAHLLSHYAGEIFICYDSDEAGQKATRKAINILGKTTQGSYNTYDRRQGPRRNNTKIRCRRLQALP